MDNLLPAVEAVVGNRELQTVFWVAVFSGLVGLVEVYRQPRVTLAACRNPAVFIYLTVLILGNSILALFALELGITLRWRGPQAWWAPFVAAVIGTFGSELLQRSDLKWLQKGILPLIKQARTKAVQVTKSSQALRNARQPASSSRRWRWLWLAVAAVGLSFAMYVYFVSQGDPRVWLLRRTKISGRFDRIPVGRLFLQIASKAGNGRAIIEREVDIHKAITLEARNEPLEAVLDRLCTICACSWTIESGDPFTLWISHLPDRSKAAPVPGAVPPQP